MSTETLNEKLARFELTISELKKEVAKLSNTKPVVDNRVSDLQTQVANLSVRLDKPKHENKISDKITAMITKDFITNLYRGK